MLARLRRVNNLLTVRPLTETLCRELEAVLRYTKRISLHGKEALLAQSHVRLEERELFCYSRERLVTAIGFLPRVTALLTRLGYAIDYADLTPHPKPEVYVPSWDSVERYMRSAGMEFRVKQREMLETIVRSDRGVVDCSVGWGKAQPLTAIVHTPGGPRRMGDISVGMQVCHPNGGTSEVVAVHPQGVVPIYRIQFHSGDFVECCADHLWVVDRLGLRNSERQTAMLTTRQLLETFRGARGVRKFAVGMSAPVQYNAQTLPIAPYTLGVLIGDGCLSMRGPGTTSFVSADEAIVRKVEAELLPGYMLRPEPRPRSKARQYHLRRIQKVSGRGHKSDYRLYLEELGLWGVKSVQKSIPTRYLYSDEESRWELLRGLMDTDGTTDKTGRASYSTSSKTLAGQVKQLVESLGGICTIHKKPTKHELSYICGVSLSDTRKAFCLERKRQRLSPRSKYQLKRVIVDIRLVGEQPAQCITVSAPDGMYVTDCCVPTHNSSLFRLIPLLFPKARIDIVTTSADIVRQIRGDMAATGLRIGQLGAGKREADSRIVVVCAKSLHRCTCDDVDIVLADEGQELATESYLQQLARYTRARMFMFSATVNMRLDSADIELEGCFGSTILKVPFELAQQHKAVVPIKVKWVPVASDYNPSSGLAGVRRARAAIWRHGFRNRIIAETAKKLGPDVQTLIVVEKIEHALALKEQLPDYTLVYAEQSLPPYRRTKFRRAGLACVMDEPQMTLQRRIWLKQQFEAGTLKKVIATSVWNRGVNFKKLSVIIRADGGGSSINDTQIPGRVCRTSDGKLYGLVIDFMDQFDRGYAQRSRRRRKNYEANGWEQFLPGAGTKSLVRRTQLGG